MKPMYLPYETEFDAETGTWSASGTDRRGDLFGVGAGDNEDAALHALRDYILDSLLGSAAHGDDFLADLWADKPATRHLVFSAQELLPVVLRLLRVRQQVRQADMAERLGMSQQAYAKLEKPGANPTLSTLVRLEQALRAPLLAWARPVGAAQQPTN